MAEKKIDLTAGFTPKPAPKIGAKDQNSGRTHLQPTHSAEQNQQLATEGLEEILPALKKILAEIPGAKLEKTRPEKDSQRTQEKIQDEGKPAATVPDYAAVRISVGSLEDNDALVEAIKKQFPVAKEKNELENGSTGEGFHAMMLQVQAPNKATIEVQVLPKEVSDIAEDTHSAYVKARGGDKAAQDDLKQQNAAAMEKFTARNQKQGKPGEEKEHKYKFGNTQVDLPPDSDAHKAIKAMQAKIPKEHLADVNEDQDKPHVTVRYGVQGEDTSKLKDYISKQTPFDAKLGKTIAFPASEHSNGASPIVAKVDSPDLHRMNGEIEKHGDFAPSNFPDYKPHVTVAYVKPEHAQKYVGMSDGEGKSFKVGHISVGDRDGNKEDVLVGGSKHPQLAKGQHVLLPDGRSGSVDFHDSRITGNARVSTDDGERIQSIPGKKLTAVGSAAAKEGEPWVGFDLDKTLAKYSTFQGPTVIGAPIPAMVDELKEHLAAGDNVRIVTARVSKDPDGKAKRAIEAWLQKNVGTALPVTDKKDEFMTKLYDDKAVAVEPNTGKILGENHEERSSVNLQQGKKEATAGNEPSGKGSSEQPSAVQPTVRPSSADAFKSALASRKPKEEEGKLVQLKPPKGHTVVSQHFRKLPS